MHGSLLTVGAIGEQLAGTDVLDVDVGILNDTVHSRPQVVDLGPAWIHVIVHGTTLADGCGIGSKTVNQFYVAVHVPDDG